MAAAEQAANERYRVGQRLKVYLIEVAQSARGHYDSFTLTSETVEAYYRDRSARNIQRHGGNKSVARKPIS